MHAIANTALSSGALYCGTVPNLLRIQARSWKRVKVDVNSFQHFILALHLQQPLSTRRRAHQIKSISSSEGSGVRCRSGIAQVGMRALSHRVEVCPTPCILEMRADLIPLDDPLSSLPYDRRSIINSIYLSSYICVMRTTSLVNSSIRKMLAVPFVCPPPASVSRN